MNITLRNFSAKNEAIGNAHKYLKNSYATYLLDGNNRELSEVLDDYIYWMNYLYGDHADRIEEFEKTIPNLNNIHVSKYHIKNFYRLINGEDDTTKNKKIINDFYEQLLDFVDQAIGKKYYFDRSFNKDERNTIGDLSCDLFKNDMCDQDLIYVYLSINRLDLHKLKGIFKKHKNVKILREKNSDIVIVEINNKYGCLCYGDFWDISNCLTPAIYFDINDNLTTNQELILDFTV
jgi:hypothetical protein